MRAPRRSRSIALLLATLAAGCTTPRLLPIDGGAMDGGIDGGARDAALPGSDAADAMPDGSIPADAWSPPDAWTCRGAVSPCDDSAQCCDDLVCGGNLEGIVCCGNLLHPCSRSDGADCCGALLCAMTSAGRVCCGADGEECAAGRECCGARECVSGRCRLP